MNVPPADTYEGQLAQRAAELLPGIGTPERLELLGVMDEDDLRTSLAFIATLNPAIFDAALVRDRKMTERLTSQLAEAEDAPCDEEPYCSACGATVGIFLAHGESYIHFRGEGTAASPVDLYDAGHEPVLSWRPAGAR